jgi:hypothetical protein
MRTGPIVFGRTFVPRRAGRLGDGDAQWLAQGRPYGQPRQPCPRLGRHLRPRQDGIGGGAPSGSWELGGGGWKLANRVALPSQVKAR